MKQSLTTDLQSIYEIAAEAEKWLDNERNVLSYTYEVSEALVDAAALLKDMDAKEESAQIVMNTYMAKIEQLQAELASSSWLDISEAPRDGTKILAINNRGNQAVVLFSELESNWIAMFSDKPSPFINGGCGSVITHFQHLPQPPKPKGDGVNCESNSL